MNVASLSKEQKQYIFLGAMVGAIALYSFSTFVVGPMKRNWAESRSEVGGLQVKVDQGERLINGKAAMAANLKESSAAMTEAADRFLPDPSNPLAWATRTLYAMARDVGLDIRAVSELAIPQVLTSQGASGDRQFGAYSVRVESECDYGLLKNFLQALQSSNPYVCISAITIDSKVGRPEQHGVNLTIEWPAWTGRTAVAGPLGEKGV